MQLNLLLGAILSMCNGNVAFVNYFTAFLKLSVSSREGVLWDFIVFCQPCSLFTVIIVLVDCMYLFSHGCWYEQADCLAPLYFTSGGKLVFILKWKSPKKANTVLKVYEESPLPHDSSRRRAFFMFIGARCEETRDKWGKSWEAEALW